MIQFNFNRFGKLAKWSLTNDRSYFVRSFLQVLVILTLIFLGFTTQFFTFKINGDTRAYEPCASIAMIILFVDLIIGPSLMFQSMKNKHDRQTLLMLPASNFEKYIMRYSTWIILLPLYVMAFFGADLIQYLVNVLGGNEQVQFVTTVLIDMVSDTSNHLWATQRRFMMTDFFVAMLWLHSVFALGGTFFRSHKYAALLTTVALIVYGLLHVWLFGMGNTSDEIKPSDSTDIIWCVSYGILIIVNFWLSYRLFCRNQVIGKFVNL
ncbi:MAG: hypothetical protein J5658_03405 [Prevotella sp.]|nr:hypothetical protein [Prevotella sp.]